MKKIRYAIIFIIVLTVAFIIYNYSSWTKIAVDNESAEILNKDYTLYFQNHDLKLSPEKRSIQYKKDENFEKILVEEILKGSVSKNLMTSIPKDTKVNLVEVRNGTAYVDLSKEFVDNQNGGSETNDLAVYSIVDTLTELININKVQFSIDGKVLKTYGQLEFWQPFERDESIIERVLEDKTSKKF